MDSRTAQLLPGCSPARRQALGRVLRGETRPAAPEHRPRPRGAPQSPPPRLPSRDLDLDLDRASILAHLRCSGGGEPLPPAAGRGPLRGGVDPEGPSCRESELLGAQRHLEHRLLMSAYDRLLRRSAPAATTPRSPSRQRDCPQAREPPAPSHCACGTYQDDIPPECHVHPETSTPSEPKTTKKRELLITQSDTDFQLPVKLKAEVEADVYIGYEENTLSKTHRTEPPTELNYLCFDCEAERAQHADGIDSQNVFLTEPRESGCDFRVIVNRGNQSKCMLSNKEHLTKILNVHAGENLVETALNTGSANPMVGWCKRIEGIHISSTVYKHEPPENMESIDYIVKPNKVNYLASLNPLPTTINHQDLYHVTDNEVNANALSTIKDFTQKYGEFLYCKVKVNPQMTISRSFLLEMSIMITKIQKIVPNNDHCKYLMKNLNQTNKHFIRFILRHRSRLSLHAQTTHTNNSVQSELSAKRCKKRRFVPKILRNGKGTETNHLTFEDTKLKTSLSADQCATISSELTFLAARAKIKSRSRWRSRSNVNAGVIANTMERGQDEVIPGQLVVSRAFTPAILDVKLSGKDRKLSRTVSKPPEETRFANEAGQVNTRGKANDRHGRKTQVRPQNSSRGRAETSSVAPTRTPRGVKGGAEPTSRRSPGQPCRPQGGRATPLLPARRTLRTRPSHFFRLFYLCTLREALISPELQEKQKSVAKNMKMIKSHSEPKLGPCLSQLPDCCRVHPSLSEGPPGQNRQAGLKVGHRTRLTAQLSGERSSGDAGSKERDCTGPPLCEQDISGVPKRTKSLDLQTKSPQPTGGRHVFPEVRGNETCKDLPERNSAVNQESVRFFVGSEDGSKQTSDESSQPPLNCCAEMLSIERHDAPEQGTPCRAGEPVSSESERDQSSDKKASRMTTTGIDVETGNVTATAPDQLESLEENLTTLLAVKETDTKQLDVSCGNDVLERNDKEILTGTSVGIQVGGLEPAMAQENYQDARLEAEAGGCSAQEVVQGLLLELVASVCQEVSSPLQERARARGAVRKMLEQYLSGADPESPELPELADRRARSCEIRTLPRGVVRERREMFARMRVFEVCSEGGRSFGGGPEVPRPPSARQVPLADALVPASPAAPLVGHTSHLAPDTCTTSFPTLLLVLVLCSVLKIVSNILTDNL